MHRFSLLFQEYVTKDIPERFNPGCPERTFKYANIITALVKLLLDTSIRIPGDTAAPHYCFDPTNRVNVNGERLYSDFHDGDWLRGAAAQHPAGVYDVDCRTAVKYVY